MSHLQRINTVFVCVRDLQAAMDFYEKVLGFDKPVIETRFWVEYALPVGDAHFALHVKNPALFEGPGRDNQSMHCSLEVQDIHGFTQLLQSRGVQFVTEPRKEYGFWLAEFKDVDGNHLRLYEKFKK